eukprot:249355-Chlamydomonas_euryale.AAC.1
MPARSTSAHQLRVDEVIPERGVSRMQQVAQVRTSVEDGVVAAEVADARDRRLGQHRLARDRRAVADDLDV